MTFDVQKISKYRTELMGVAAILIFVVHSYDQGVLMPSYIKTLCALGSLGVDMFLLVSGLGLYYSLYMNGGGKRWYLSRYKRILVPYLLIGICTGVPFIDSIHTLLLQLLDLSTINFWLKHRGAWYIAMLIPLYAITPLHYKICQKVKHPVCYNILIIILLTAFVSVPFQFTNDTLSNIVDNVRHVAYRLPAFFVGFILAPLAFRTEKLSLLWLVILPLIIVVSERTLHFGYWPGMLVLPLIVFLCQIFDKLSRRFMLFFRFFGTISLESYLFNVSIGSLIIKYFPFIYVSDYNYGCYLHYTLVVIFGTLFSYLTHLLCVKIINNSQYKT